MQGMSRPPSYAPPELTKVQESTVADSFVSYIEQKHPSIAKKVRNGSISEEDAVLHTSGYGISEDIIRAAYRKMRGS
jgi:hypothetical protein